MYTPEQNGVAERKNRTIVEAACAMLYDQGLLKFLWGEAVNTVLTTLRQRSHSGTPPFFQMGPIMFEARVIQISSPIDSFYK